MSREQRLALVAGFAVLLAVAVLISDHLSRARSVTLADGDVIPQSMPVETLEAARAVLPPPELLPAPGSAVASPSRAAAKPVEVAEPVAKAALPTPEPLVIANGPGSSGGSTLEKLRELAQAAGVDFEYMNSPVTMAKPDRPDWGRGGTSRGGDAVSDPEPAPSRPLSTPVASSPAAPAVTSPGTAYIVKPGESLYKIAEAMLGDGNRWREIAAINSDRVLKDGNVQVGVRLVLPVVSQGTKETEPARVVASKPVAVAPRAARSATRSYVVAKGDTLGRIAQRELGTVRRKGEILALNKGSIRDADAIMVGMTIELPAE